MPQFLLSLGFGQREGLFRLDRDRQGVLRVYPGQLLQRAEGGGVMTGADAGPAHRDPIMAAASAPAAPVDEPLDVAEPIEYTPAAASSVAGAAPAPAAKAAKRRVGAAKKPAAAKKAAPKGRVAKAPAPPARKRAAKKAEV